MTSMQVAAPKSKVIRRAHPGQGVPMWRTSKWPDHRSCVENGEKGLGRDHLYSVAALTNSAGVVVERYSYDAYGARKILAPDGVTTRAASSYNQQIGFTGRYQDKETGLWYFRARYYSGSLGRFVNRDPLEYINGNSLYNSYFAANFTDAFGLYKVSVTAPLYYKPQHNIGFPKIPALDKLLNGERLVSTFKWEWSFDCEDGGSNPTLTMDTTPEASTGGEGKDGELDIDWMEIIKKGAEKLDIPYVDIAASLINAIPTTKITTSASATILPDGNSCTKVQIKGNAQLVGSIQLPVIGKQKAVLDTASIDATFKSCCCCRGNPKEFDYSSGLVNRGQVKNSKSGLYWGDENTATMGKCWEKKSDDPWYGKNINNAPAPQAPTPQAPNPGTPPIRTNPGGGIFGGKE